MTSATNASLKEPKPIHTHSDSVACALSKSIIALITVPFFTGAIGYVTNWTGVLMLFYPVHFRGFRASWLSSMARLAPFKIRQIISGSNASVVTAEGDRIYIGDEFRGMRLAAVTNHRLTFVGKRKVEVRW